MDRWRACLQTVQPYRITVAVCGSVFIGVLVFVLAPPLNPCVIRRGMDLFQRSNEPLRYVKDVDGPWAFHGVPWLRKVFLLW